MNRLTERLDNGKIVFTDYAHYYKEDIEELDLDLIAKYICQQEDLAEQGQLVKLPCRVGDTVWFITPEYSDIRGYEVGEIGCMEVESIEIKEPYWTLNREWEFLPKDFGDILFITQKEAAKRLAELEDSTYDQTCESYIDGKCTNQACELCKPPF